MAVLSLGPSTTFVAAAGSQNNVTPAPAITGLNRLLVNTNAGAATFTGLAAGTDGQLLWLTNTGAGDLTLANENAASTITNRFESGAIVGDLIVIGGGGNLLLYYDSAIGPGTPGRWIMGV
jgi:hypothetical protein